MMGFLKDFARAAGQNKTFSNAMDAYNDRDERDAQRRQQMVLQEARDRAALERQKASIAAADIRNERAITAQNERNAADNAAMLERQKGINAVYNNRYRQQKQDKDAERARSARKAFTSAVGSIVAGQNESERGKISINQAKAISDATGANLDLKQYYPDSEVDEKRVAINSALLFEDVVSGIMKNQGVDRAEAMDIAASGITGFSRARNAADKRDKKMTADRISLMKDFTPESVHKYNITNNIEDLSPRTKTGGSGDIETYTTKERIKSLIKQQADIQKTINSGIDQIGNPLDPTTIKALTAQARNLDNQIRALGSGNKMAIPGEDHSVPQGGERGITNPAHPGITPLIPGMDRPAQMESSATSTPSAPVPEQPGSAPAANRKTGDLGNIVAEVATLYKSGDKEQAANMLVAVKNANPGAYADIVRRLQSMGASGDDIVTRDLAKLKGLYDTASNALSYHATPKTREEAYAEQMKTWGLNPDVWRK